jgi:hypothetical protein
MLLQKEEKREKQNLGFIFWLSSIYQFIVLRGRLLSAIGDDGKRVT